MFNDTEIARKLSFKSQQQNQCFVSYTIWNNATYFGNILIYQISILKIFSCYKKKINFILFETENLLNAKIY